MSEASRGSVAAKLRGALRFVACSTICFILLSSLLSWVHLRRGEPDWQVQVRAAILRDVIEEVPIGRQALVSSIWLMPLPSIAALPFTPLLEPEAYGLAYLYGLALTMALATVPLASLLRKARVPASTLAAIAVLALCACTIGGSSWSDFLACLSCLVIAAYFEAHSRPALRALAGAFYGLALFAHAFGFVAAGAKAVWVVVRRALGKPGPEHRAVHFIQLVTMAYVLCVYLFLNWMIMRSPLWALRHLALQAPAPAGSAPIEELAELLGEHYGDSAPVVSGHWGYLVEPILRSTSGHHFIDFHRDKVPLWERRELLLVMPKPGNPLVSLCDIAAVLRRRPAALAGYVLLREGRYWDFYLIVKKRRSGAPGPARNGAEHPT